MRIVCKSGAGKKGKKVGSVRRRKENGMEYGMTRIKKNNIATMKNKCPKERKNEEEEVRDYRAEVSTAIDETEHS